MPLDTETRDASQRTGIQWKVTTTDGESEFNKAGKDAMALGTFFKNSSAWYKGSFSLNK